MDKQQTVGRKPEVVQYKDFARRSFLGIASSVSLCAVTRPVTSLAATAELSGHLSQRIEGLLLGSLIGDALGGPIEFQDSAKIQSLPRPPKCWKPSEILDCTQINEARGRLELKPYAPLRPESEPYGQWSSDAPPGTITDDSRHKIILMEMLRRSEREKRWPVTAESLAQCYLDWPDKWKRDSFRDYLSLCDEWLEEIHFSARWVLGERDPVVALPPDRLWVGLTTCCGQMTLLPLAAIFAGEPQAAYLSGYSIDFLDNGWGRDLNCALLAGLATALRLDSDRHSPRTLWSKVIAEMCATDPYRYREVPWSERSVERWLRFAQDAARNAAKVPHACFQQLDKEFWDTTKWEAQVPFVVMFAALEMCDYDPQSALQLSLEWGHDTDSYAQLLGAFLGALYGPNVFPNLMRTTVAARLKADYGEDLQEWVDLLLRLNRNRRSQRLFDLPNWGGSP